MAFKMKGSAFKLNNIATASALKQESQDLKTMTVEELKALSQKLTTQAEQMAKKSQWWGGDDFTKEDAGKIRGLYLTDEDYNPDAAKLKQIVEIMRGKLEAGEI